MTQALSNDKKVVLSTAQTAKEIRNGLKGKHSGVKFSVICKAGSITISWEGGPSKKTVEQLVKIFEGSCVELSGGIDLIKGSKDLVEHQGMLVDFGVDYIFCKRTLSDEDLVKVAKYVCDRHGRVAPSIERLRTRNYSYEISEQVERLANETDIDDLSGLGTS